MNQFLKFSKPNQKFNCAICLEKFLIVPDAITVVGFGPTIEEARLICPKCFKKISSQGFNGLWIKSVKKT